MKWGQGTGDEKFSHSHQFKYLGNVFAPFTMQKQHIYAGKLSHAQNSAPPLHVQCEEDTSRTQLT